jgi:hypothetical protein
MASLKKLFAEVRDPNDYDGAVFLCTKDGQVANIGFTGSMPQGIDQKAFLYRLLMEGSYALVFTPQPSTDGSDAPSN